MLGKLIIVGIIIAAVAILVPTVGKSFSPSINALENRIDQATSDSANQNTTTSTLGKVIGGGEKIVNTLESKSDQPSSLYNLSSKYVTKQNYTGQVFEKNGSTCDISVPGMAQVINGQQEITHVIELNQCTMKSGDPVQVTALTAKPNAPDVSPSSGIQVTPYSFGSNTNSNLPALPPYYNIVQLDAQNQGNNALINYDYTTGNTKSVTVTMKNNDKVLFSGTFYSSKFSTEVKDVPNTPHIIEMTVDNSIYGILHASVYAPSNLQNSTITGIFTQ